MNVYGVAYGNVLWKVGVSLFTVVNFCDAQRKQGNQLPCVLTDHALSKVESRA